MFQSESLFSYLSFEKSQFSQIADSTSTANYFSDLDGQSATNYYQYDQTGNLIQKGDNATGNTISWNVYGKIQQVDKHGTGANTITYSYDASGNRINKTTNTATTYYVRDASGNVMAVYEGTSTQMKMTETDLYGSNRLGLVSTQTVATVEQTVSGFGTVRTLTFTRGEKSYELSNHLGNVLSTISDRRQQMPVNSTVSYYMAEVTSATDYYPFGMQMPGRTVSSSSYRYGFNGQEKSSELTEGQYTAEYWEYDSRSGRRWNLDPVIKEWESPYASLSNNPIWNIDPDGDSDTTAINGVPVDRLNDGLKMANDYVKKLLKQKKVGGDLNDANKSNLSNLVYDYYQKHKDEMSFGEYLSMGGWVNKAFQSLDAIAWWRSSDFVNLNESLINNTKISDASRIFKFVDESNKYANDRIGTLAQGARAGIIISSAALFPTIGKPPLSVPSLATRPIINSVGIKSATIGKIIGWGEGQGFMAVTRTRITTMFLTRESVQRAARMGMTKQWVEKQLASYTKSLLTKPNAINNTQIFARKELMEKILRLW